MSLHLHRSVRMVAVAAICMALLGVPKSSIAKSPRVDGPSRDDTLAAIVTIWHDCGRYTFLQKRDGSPLEEDVTLPAMLSGSVLMLPYDDTGMEGTRYESQHEYINKIDLSDLKSISVEPRRTSTGSVFLSIECATYACAFGNGGLGQAEDFGVCNLESAQRLVRAVEHLARFFPRRKPPAF